MDKENSVLTNITLQTFASEGDAALIDQRWEKEGPAFLKEHIEPKVEEALNAAGFVSQSKYNALKNIATKLEARIDELEKKL